MTQGVSRWLLTEEARFDPKPICMAFVMNEVEL